MIEYAESNMCRRRIILDHFGDPGDPDAPECCDNCLARHATPPPPRGVAATPPPPSGVAPTTPPPLRRGLGGGPSAGAASDPSPTLPAAGREFSDPSPTLPSEGRGQLTPENKTALLILDTVRSLPWEVGRGKIANLLKGSRRKEMSEFGYDRNPRYGKLGVFSVAEIEGLVDDMVEMGYLKGVGGKLPVLRLTPTGEAALASREAIPLTFPRPVVRSQPKPPRNSSTERGQTLDITADMFDRGMIPAQIAQERGLAVITIEGHLAQLVGQGRIEMSRIVSDERAARIREALAQVGDATYLTPIKQALPDDFTFSEIKCVLAADGFQRAPRPPEPPNHPTPEPSNPDDPVAAYLSRSHPRPLVGPWNVGWALGFHSSFAGSDWRRSGVGEMTFKLKYRQDESVLQPLVDEAVRLCRQHTELLNVDAIVPVPPSTKRPHDPVRLFCQAMSRKTNLPLLDVVTRTRPTKPQKEMRTLAAKRANVAGAFAVNERVRGGVLVIDDLYDSGATLEEVVSALKRAGARSVCVLTLTRTIHSDS